MGKKSHNSKEKNVFFKSLGNVKVLTQYIINIVEYPKSSFRI